MRLRYETQSILRDNLRDLAINMNQFELEDFVYESCERLRKLIFDENGKMVSIPYLGSGEQALYHSFRRMENVCEAGACLLDVVEPDFITEAQEFMSLLDEETHRNIRSKRFIELSYYFVLVDTPDDLPDYKKELIKEAYSALQYYEIYTFEAWHDPLPLHPKKLVEVGDREDIVDTKFSLHIKLRRLDEILAEFHAPTIAKEQIVVRAQFALQEP